MLHRLMTCALLAGALTAAVASCGSTSKGSSGTGEPEEIIVKKASLAWGIKPAGDGAEVFLAVTDETGRVTSHPLGRYDGECAAIDGGRPSTGALLAVLCKRGDVGVELDAIPRPGVIIVLKFPYVEGADPDPLAGQEIEHVEVPVGAKIETTAR